MIKWVIIGIVVLLAVIVIGMYNGFIRSKNDCEEAFSTMDVYLKKRYDLIPNLVETVKGYAAHEKETFEKLTLARTRAMEAVTADEKVAVEPQVQQGLKNLFAVAENYPELKANQNFLDLQNQLQSVENDIANSRKYYNATVKTFNNKCEVFPSNILAGIFGFKKKAMFEVAGQEERENVKVQF